MHRAINIVVVYERGISWITTTYLVQGLLDLLELFWCQCSWVDILDFTTKVGKLGGVGGSWKEEGDEFDGHYIDKNCDKTCALLHYILPRLVTRRVWNAYNYQLLISILGSFECIFVFWHVAWT